MSRDKQRLDSYLNHILEAIERIEKYTENLSETDFLKNELVQDAVIRNFEVIGEASRNIQRHHPEFEAKHPEIPLALAYEMRNAIAHGYFKIDLEILWRTIHNNLPELHQKVHQALKN